MQVKRLHLWDVADGAECWHKQGSTQMPIASFAQPCGVGKCLLVLPTIGVSKWGRQRKEIATPPGYSLMETRMNFKEAINILHPQKSTAIVQEECENRGKTWDISIHSVFSCVASNPELAPENIGTNKDNAESAVKRWVSKYFSGYENRASQRISSLPGTVPDSIIDTIIGGRLPHLSKQRIEHIKYAHRLSMSAENVLGLLLEEYLAERLAACSWHCAWGETVKSVDFVNEDGRLLQIKNRSNSENSSSSRVRNGTNIEKWHRINHKTGAYNWGGLNQICTIELLSEKDFVTFVSKTLRTNPKCLAVEPENTWQS
jgi:hypothetical protein